ISKVLNGFGNRRESSCLITFKNLESVRTTRYRPFISNLFMRSESSNPYPVKVSSYPPTSKKSFFLMASLPNRSLFPVIQSFLERELKVLDVELTKQLAFDVKISCKYL